MIKDNKELQSLIFKLRNLPSSNYNFKTMESLNAFFEIAILMFEKLSEPFVKQNDTNYKSTWNNYFKENLSIDLNNNPQNAIFQLKEMQKKGETLNIELSFRVLEVIARDNEYQFSSEELDKYEEILLPFFTQEN